jgi:hypothetical protein
MPSHDHGALLGPSMQTNVRTPTDVFNLPQRLQVPLFQRPYVWSQEKQWEPLWRDVERIGSTVNCWSVDASLCKMQHRNDTRI